MGEPNVPETGFVTLVGAGPGDPGLFTLAGKQALQNAEVVLFDRLVGDGILSLIPCEATRIDVGKNKGSHPTPQHEINRLLLVHAQQGKRVVRLKGGDPYLFGRGAEELELLREHGIPFQVVPGITSAIAVPAYAGIPVTHRNFSSSLHIITGHGKEGAPPDIPFAELARLKGTLVFLMGLSTLEDICSGLLHAGMPADTPAALIENGSRPEQRKLLSPLSAMPALARERNFAPPAVFVVGRVCALTEKFDWFSELPLLGRKILTVSSNATSSRLAAKLRTLGCAVDELPCICMRPLPVPETLWQEVTEMHWVVLTSRYGAELFFDQLRTNGVDMRRLAGVKFAVVGTGTADILKAHGVFPDYMPAEYNAVALADGLRNVVGTGERVLLYRAREASRVPDQALAASGADCAAIDAYETVRAEGPLEDTRAKLVSGAYDMVTFTSASSVKSFVAAMDGVDCAKARALCIGEMTAGAARAAGMSPEVAGESTLDGMAARILERLDN